MSLFDSIPSGSAKIILTLAVMLFAGFLVTRLTKRLRLPNVTGYIVAGVLIGPWALRLVSAQMVGQMEFVTDLALAFIAFGVGKYFKLSQLKKSGWSVIVLTLFESLIAGAMITVCMIFLFQLPVGFSLLLGAIGCATAPASTIMTIRQYKAKGAFVNLILQIVALDDAVALLAFSVCAAAVRALSAGTGDLSMLLLPLLFNVLTLLLGAGAGWLLHRLVDYGRSGEHHLVLSIAVILTVTGVCTALDVSPLLCCMMLGTVYTNVGGSKQTFKRLNKFTPPVLLLFFVLSGARLSLPSLAVAGGIGVAYFLIRIAGKYLGAYLGARVCKSPQTVRRYLGLALIPQAGVSIGLAALGQRILPGEMGVLLSTIILSSGLLYEMVGPACAKASLFLSHTITPGKAEPAADTGETERVSLKKEELLEEKEDPAREKETCA